ncbi:MAG: type II secretion system protein [Alphaproteobacteria bacterium]|nr:type II secretion system protein [Alphaproteobacteria bacterium]
MKKAFTLIELLIVVAVIGILSSIVIVSLTGSTTKANSAQIKANVRTIVTKIAVEISTPGSGVTLPSAGPTGNICTNIISSGLPAQATLAANAGNGIGCSSTSTGFLVYWAKNPSAVPATTTNHAWCIDSIGNSGKIDTKPGITVVSCSSVGGWVASDSTF